MSKMGRPDLRQKVLDALPGTREELAKKAEVSTSTVGKWLAILRAEELVHISDYQRSHMGAKRPVFVSGPGKDAEPPPSLTQAESQERYCVRHPGRRTEIRKRYEAKVRDAKRAARRLEQIRRTGWAQQLFAPRRTFF